MIGFFEVFGPRGLEYTGPTTSADTTSFSFPEKIAAGELLCVRFFAKSTGGFVELGTAQCTTSPF